MNDNQSKAQYIWRMYCRLSDETFEYVLRLLEQEGQNEEKLKRHLIYWTEKSPEFIDRQWSDYDKRPISPGY